MESHDLMLWARDFLAAVTEQDRDRLRGFFCPETPYVLSMEVKPWGDEDAETVVANTKRVLNRAWSLVKD